ncbi:MAG: CPBP family intramembrane metalloprotease [Oscillospiraceae bacterium]|nr:CPBP family intramembrane metalloprotease [Oscillospiraceae bacterium]
MEQINNIPQVSVIPDAEERKQIRKQYDRTALVLIVDILIFNLGAWTMMYLICAYYGGGFGREAIMAGREIFRRNELLSTLYSCIIPIAAETASIILGVKLLGLNIRSFFTRDGYGGGTVVKLITLSAGMQTAASLLAVILAFLLGSLGLTGATPDFSGRTSLGANIILCVYACIVGPILEELLFRGVVLQSMRKYNERFAIFLSALIFGLMHQNYQQFLAGFLIGIPLAIVAVKYNSILPTIFAHIFVNTLATLTSGVIQFVDPEYYESIAGGAVNADISLPQGGAAAAIIVNFIVTYGFLIAAIIVGTISLVKGRNMTVPTPAGKARSRIIYSSVLWWIVFAAYLFLCFVYPFIR